MDCMCRVRPALAITAIAFVLSLLLSLAPRAEATIGRADLDGTGIAPLFIADPTPSSPTQSQWGVAVDAGHVYWANFDFYSAVDTIGRADLDGSNVNQSFIAGVGDPRGVAVDAEHIYWANSATDTIGRANLDGTGVDPNFISDAGESHAVAVDGGHVYWGLDQGGPDGIRIGRANLDGTGVDKSFINPSASGLGVFGPVTGLAVDAGHVYWATGVVIGRANLDGTGVNQVFITPCTGSLSSCSAGSTYVSSLAVDDAHVFFSGSWQLGSDYVDAIGRANLDGTGIDLSFITTTFPNGVAVDAGHVYWSWAGATAPPVTCLGAEQTYTGTKGKDDITGTALNDLILGLAGHDLLDGAGGNDCVKGNAGDDTVRGGAGDDLVRGGDGADVHQGGNGNDKLRSADDVRDVVNCGPGDDDQASVDELDDVKGCEQVTVVVE